MQFVQTGDQFVDSVVVLDATGTPVSADDTPVLRVFASGGTEIDMTGSYDIDEGDTGRYVVTANMIDDLEVGSDYTAFVECEVDGLLISTPLPTFSTFRVCARDPGNLVEQLEQRHGQGAWGPRYDAKNEDGTAPAAPVIPYGTWSKSWLFDDATQPGKSEYGGINLAQSIGSTLSIEKRGVMGPADSSLTTDTGADVLTVDDGGSAMDVTTGDIAFAAAFIGDNNGSGPRVGKIGAGHGYLLYNPTGSLKFRCNDGSNHDVSVNTTGSEFVRGGVVIAALSKSTNKVRIGFMTRDGDIQISTLVDVTGMGSLTNAIDFTIACNESSTLLSALQIAIGSGAATGVPENLEACLRAYHASVFGADVAVRELVGVPANATVSADIAAIDAKTTNLPSDPADESLVIAATDAIMARLGTPAGASIAADIAAETAAVAVVDGIVDAIKVITDQFVFTVANKVDATADVVLGTDAIDESVISDAAYAAIGEAVWSTVLEGSSTAADMLRGGLSILAGKVTSFLTNTLVFKGAINAAKSRWTFTVDSTGRLTSTPGDLT